MALFADAMKKDMTCSDKILEDNIPASDTDTMKKDMTCNGKGICSLSIEERMEIKGVKPTSNRILVMRVLEEAARPISLADIEELSDTLDKSTISRTLSLFLERDIVHSFEDGRGVINYELCMESGECDHCDRHLHFYCEKCRRSFCLNHINPEEIRLPEGYEPHSFSFVVKGICPSCKASSL